MGAGEAIISYDELDNRHGQAPEAGITDVKALAVTVCNNTQHCSLPFKFGINDLTSTI